MSNDVSENTCTAPCNYTLCQKILNIQPGTKHITDPTSPNMLEPPETGTNNSSTKTLHSEPYNSINPKQHNLNHTLHACNLMFHHNKTTLSLDLLPLTPI
ncbi:hypothetical protein Bca4012_063101 [Brassica carinata]